MLELKPQPDKETIEFLEGLVEDARAGELQGVIVAGTGPGSVYTASAGKTRLYDSLGCILAVGVYQLLKNDQQVREMIVDIIENGP